MRSATVGSMGRIFSAITCRHDTIWNCESITPITRRVLSSTSGLEAPWGRCRNLSSFLSFGCTNTWKYASFKSSCTVYGLLLKRSKSSVKSARRLGPEFSRLDRVEPSRHKRYDDVEVLLEITIFVGSRYVSGSFLMESRCPSRDPIL